MSGYGKHFESMYTGTMFGSGADVFAIWGYAISHCRHGEVELNPKVLAATIGMSTREVEDAISFLCAEDANSRSQAESGKRLVKTGAFTYRMPTYERYNATHSADEIRTFERERKQKYRNSLKTNVPDSPGQTGTVPDKQGLSHTPAPAPAPDSKTNTAPSGAMRANHADDPKAIFERLKTIYPQRDGSHRWADAAKHFQARLREGATAREIEDGVLRYAKYCYSRGLTGTDKVQQAATFLGTNRGYAEPWEVVRKPVLVKTGPSAGGVYL